MRRPYPRDIEPSRKLLYWAISATCATLGLVLALTRPYPGNVLVGVGWLLLALVWALLPAWASRRRGS